MSFLYPSTSWAARMLAGEKILQSSEMVICFRAQIHGANVPSSNWQPSGVQPYENSYVPSSSATSTVVRGPYNATSDVSWSRPVAPRRPSAPEPDFEPQMPIMVPTAQLLSTMDDPSSGSQQTVYSPSGLQAFTSGSSSEAPKAIVGELLQASHII